jgi:hypothetical protein
MIIEVINCGGNFRVNVFCKPSGFRSFIERFYSHVSKANRKFDFLCMNFIVENCAGSDLNTLHIVFPNAKIIHKKADNRLEFLEIYWRKNSSVAAWQARLAA